MKVIKERVDSSNFLMLEGTNTVIAAGPNAVGINKDAGVFINGPVSFSSPVDNIKFSGLFKFNPIATSGLPSTLITPIPTFKMEVPIKGIAQMGSIASLLSSLI